MPYFFIKKIVMAPREGRGGAMRSVSISIFVDYLYYVMDEIHHG